MAKLELRILARQLRGKGISVNQIASELKIAKSTVSLWVRDIVLSIDQLEALRNASVLGAERGRLKGALVQKERRLKALENYKRLGKESIGSLNDRELLIAGLALYWGEGSKKTKEVQFCNSDPQMIKLLLIWLKKCFGTELQDIRCKVGINEIHKCREKQIREYWSKMTRIPLEQFTKTSFKKVLNKKVYNNFETHYGTLSVKVKQPSRFYGRIIGLIEGLAEAKMPR